ncbi:MAG: hypothetical protein LBT40_17380 [Deltaproteobacteria bacterium]|nr:hypothetical protein [Deltaproteobacteria bacterium]
MSIMSMTESAGRPILKSISMASLAPSRDPVPRASARILASSARSDAGSSQSAFTAAARASACARSLFCSSVRGGSGSPAAAPGLSWPSGLSWPEVLSRVR